MGKYILDTFFGGSFESLRAERTHATWRALSQHEDLHVSHSTLWFSVATLEQYRALPASVASALTVSHYRKLVPIRNPDAKVRIAEKAASEGWTVLRLEAEVKKQRTKAKSRVGRPTLPAHLKALRRYQGARS